MAQNTAANKHAVAFTKALVDFRTNSTNKNAEAIVKMHDEHFSRRQYTNDPTSKDVKRQYSQAIADSYWTGVSKSGTGRYVALVENMAQLRAAIDAIKKYNAGVQQAGKIRIANALEDSETGMAEEFAAQKYVIDEYSARDDVKTAIANSSPLPMPDRPNNTLPHVLEQRSRGVSDREINGFAYDSLNHYVTEFSEKARNSISSIAKVNLAACGREVTNMSSANNRCGWRTILSQTDPSLDGLTLASQSVHCNEPAVVFAVMQLRLAAAVYDANLADNRGGIANAEQLRKFLEERTTARMLSSDSKGMFDYPDIPAMARMFGRTIVCIGKVPGGNILSVDAYTPNMQSDSSPKNIIFG
ncbi:MAG: hypothetical protein LBT64_01710, partial [Puniceicoccales bacterium]|nr:hypothetical protein [Puniceicoccales bacterium]